MINILFIYNVIEPSSIMMKRFMKQLCMFYNLEFIGKKAVEVKEADINCADILLFIRSQSPIEAQLSKLVKKKEKVIALVLDDDFYALDHYNVRRVIQKWSLDIVLHNVDYVISGNDALGKKMCKLGSCKYARIDTTITDKDIYTRIFTKIDGIIKIVYYASDGSLSSFNNIISGMLEIIAERYGDKIKWYFYTVHPNMKGTIYEHQAIYYKRLSYDDFKKSMRLGDYDIGIAPLNETEQTSGKYINKFMEYSMAGIPGIYSKVEPYSSFVRDGIDGVLCDNTSEGWLNAFEKMQNIDFRKQCVLNAQNRLREEFSEDRVFSRLVHDMPELLFYKAPSDKRVTRRDLLAVHLISDIMNVIDPICRVVGRWRIEGFRSVVKWTWEQYVSKFLIDKSI